jgi:threonyl-tRNA synthetase
MNITDSQSEYVRDLEKKFSGEDIRVEIDLRNEKIGYKIREAQLEKIPYMLVVGDKEMANNQVAVRDRKQGDIGVMDVDVFIEMIKAKIKDKSAE